MMGSISEACRCGASFVVQYRSLIGESRMLAEWRASHEGCRAAYAARMEAETAAIKSRSEQAGLIAAMTAGTPWRAADRSAGDKAEG